MTPSRFLDRPRRCLPILGIRPAVAAVSALMLGSVAQAANGGGAGPVVYGRLNLGLEQVGGGGRGSLSRLSNDRSVLGFRGEESLGDGWSAVWQIEGSVLVDTGGGTSLANRDTRLGLSGPWGTAFGGVWTLPYTAATSGFDPFYPTTAGYMALIGNGSASIADNLSDSTAFDRRQQNVLQYWTPTAGGWSGRLAFSPGEERSTVTGARPSLWSSSLTYAASDLTAVWAHEQHRRFQTADSTDRAWKLGVSGQLGATRLSALIERLDYRTATGPLRRDALYVSAVHKIGRLSVMGGLSVAGDGKGRAVTRVGPLARGAQTGAVQLTVGVDQALSRRTSLFAWVSRIRNDAAARYDFAINSPGAMMGSHPSVLSVGMKHSF
ncbi:porin [Roseateles amylovorans]|uniref:Porin n=1 Tax=Roseateles amylovorans TaxID=2978473 RepID=A0ABY6AUU8_9BURK|nr:porin [Roseateles amylovorans]UXH76350.1 porin [Roseateles amylovorans]